MAVDDGKKGNWLRKEFSFSMAVVEDFNVFQFKVFFSMQWRLMNIYNFSIPVDDGKKGNWLRKDLELGKLERAAK